MKPPPFADVNVSQVQIDEILALARAAAFPEQQYELLELVLTTFMLVMLSLQKARTTMKRFREMLFGKSTESKASLEKTPGGVGEAENAPDVPLAQDQASDKPKKEKKAPKGHGRNGAEAYFGAVVTHCPHTGVRTGDLCPKCGVGKLYRAVPRIFVKVTGQLPIGATIFERESWRCRLCEAIFTAPFPDGFDARKYDEGCASMIAILRYGSGMPFHRLEALQAFLGVPLPDATQWDIVEQAATAPRLVYTELGRQAAQAKVLYNDDTKMQVLSESGERRAKARAEASAEAVAVAKAAIEAAGEARAKARAEAEAKIESEAQAMAAGGTKAKAKAAIAAAAARAKAEKAEARAAKADARTLARAGKLPPARAINTTGIVADLGGRKITLYFTGPRHAGENLGAMLAQRAADLGAPIQMCDALAANVTGALATILSNCITHGRRKFVEVAEYFPAHCMHVITEIAKVYANDEICKKENMSAEQRLAFHQANSAPVMAALKAWMDSQFDQKLVEPNSGLGQALGYMIRHWQKMTLFLRKAGAPLDNNICERALKKAIIHRKNSYFYRSLRGAEVGDVYMSLIHTCQSCGANPFDYLTQLQKHVAQVRANPDQWLPWNYTEALARASQSGS